MRQASTCSDQECEQQLEGAVIELVLQLAHARKLDDTFALHMFPRMRRLAPGPESCSDRISGASCPGSVQFPVAKNHGRRGAAMCV